MLSPAEYFISFQSYFVSSNFYLKKPRAIKKSILYKFSGHPMVSKNDKMFGRVTQLEKRTSLFYYRKNHSC